MEKKLYRSKHDKTIAGVCSGVAKYFGLDPTVIRVAWGVISVFAWIGIVAYLVCAFVVPEEPDYIESE